MRTALAFSVVIHLAVLLLAYFGIPMAQRELVVDLEPVAIDVVSVADTTNLPPPTAEPEKPAPAVRVDPKPKAERPAEAKAEPKFAANAKPQPQALLKPEREPETEPETEKVQPPPKADEPVQVKPQHAKPPPSQQTEPQQAAKAEPQPAPPRPTPVREPNKAAVEPRPAPPPKPVPQREKPAQDRQAPSVVAKNEPASAPPEAKPSPAPDFQSVLKTVGTLARSEAQKPVAQKSPPKAQTGAKPADGEAKNANAPEQAFASRIKQALGPSAASPSAASGRPYDAAQPITVSEIDEVRRQIERCWNVPAGARDAGDHVVTIRVEMSPDATPRSATVLNEGTTRDNAFYRAAAESALRAVLNPRCHPFKLPVEKYDRWKTMTLVFNPKDMLGT
jgi:hypothetical protein